MSRRILLSLLGNHLILLLAAAEARIVPASDCRDCVITEGCLQEQPLFPNIRLASYTDGFSAYH